MKPPPHRDPDVHRAVTSAPLENHSIGERGMHAINARPPPAFHHRRYPSLSDDGDLYFPRLRRLRRPADESGSVTKPPGDTDELPHVSVRAFALLAIIVIITALVAGA